MTRTKALIGLLALVQSDWMPGDNDVVLGPWQKVFGHNWKSVKAHEAYNGSLDAAKALFEAVLGGWVANIYSNRLGNWRVALDSPIAPHKVSMGLSKCPARAWLIAILSALIAQEAAQAAEGVE